MPALPTPFSVIQYTIYAWSKALAAGWPARGEHANQPTALGETAAAMGLNRSNLRVVRARLDTAVALGLTVSEWDGSLDPEWNAKVRLNYGKHDLQYLAWSSSNMVRRTAKAQSNPTPPADTFDELAAKVVPLLRRASLTIEALANKLKVDPHTAEAAIEQARTNGAAIAERGGLWHFDDTPALGIQRNEILTLTTDDEGRAYFGACGDMHLCSRYERLDCLNDYYDEIERRGIQIVLNTGNWIDGEAPFNRHELLVHGMDQQMQYLAEHYPQREGVETWAVTGADHEGWYARREGVDVGRYAAGVMEARGRTDWLDLGFMEAYVRLEHPKTGQGSMIHVMHPGGGSAYALSYAPQKIVESYDGGDKPAMLLIGHYHKSGYNLIRNVHTAQTGTFQDQTVFMRQKKLAAHLGGCFIEVLVDPDSGAMVECSYTFRNYFPRSYYNGKWSQHGPVQHAPRSAL